MGNNYLFSLTPTFTQGLLLGQLSIILVLALVLKYLFLLPQSDESEPPIFHPFPKPDSSSRTRLSPSEGGTSGPQDPESANWFNSLARQVADVYRAKLQSGLEGFEGNECARAQIEAYANKIRPRGFLDRITIHAVDLGNSAPLLSDAQLVEGIDGLTAVKFHMLYTDTISVSLSTAYLFNYPMSSFARLPVSLTVTLDLFESFVTVAPPSPFSSESALAISFPSEFTLNLKTTSLLGSRAMLKDVPKLHELIEHQVRRVLASRGTWKVALPGLGNLAASTENGERGVSGESTDPSVAL